jgi:hypothetical protein
MTAISLLRLTTIGFILIFAIWLQTHTIISGDITWLMQVGKRLIEGGHYYKDFIEVNPPMAIYIYLIPVLFSMIFHIDFISSVTIYVFLISILSWLICSYLLKQIFPKTANTVRYIFEISLAFSLFILPAYAFGQREYFLIILMLPYLLLAILRIQQQLINRWFSLFIGLMAGIGFAIKPFFLLAWGLIEIYLIVRTKTLKIALRIEGLSCLGLFIFYCISILLMTPEYITQSKALIQPIYYRNFRVPFSWLLGHNIVIFSILALCNYCLVKKQLYYQTFCDLLAISIISMLIIFLAQQTLWFYHLLPVLFFTILLLTLVTTAHLNYFFKIEQLSLALFATAGANFILLILVSYGFFIIMGNINASFYLTKELLNSPIYNISKSAAGKPIYIFTNNIAINYPLIDYTQTYSPSAFPCLWLISAAYKLRQDADTPAQKKTAEYISNFARTTDINNIIAHKPVFIFVQREDNLIKIQHDFLFRYSFTIQKIPAFDFLKFFLQDPHFAQFWQNYQYEGQTKAFAIYKLK